MTEEKPTPDNAPPTETILSDDLNSINLAKANKQLALAEAKTALAKNENADLSYKYTVLQVYMKYRLDESDVITDEGIIKRGANKKATS
jgi:hypothetical protein